MLTMGEIVQAQSKVVLSVEALAKLCEWEEGQEVAHGYTFDRHTVDITYSVRLEGAILTRSELVRRGQPDEWKHQDYTILQGYDIFKAGIKRWYRGQTCPKLVNLFSQFDEYGMPMVD